MTNKDVHKHLESLTKATFKWTANPSEELVNEIKNSLTEEDKSVINFIDSLEKDNRLDLLLEIIDNIEIELHTGVMMIIRDKYLKSFLNMREENLSKLRP